MGQKGDVKGQNENSPHQADIDDDTNSQEHQESEIPDKKALFGALEYIDLTMSKPQEVIDITGIDSVLFDATSRAFDLTNGTPREFIGLTVDVTAEAGSKDGDGMGVAEDLENADSLDTELEDGIERDIDAQEAAILRVPSRSLPGATLLAASIAMLGDGGVGKTALAFTLGSFLGKNESICDVSLSSMSSWELRHQIRERLLRYRQTYDPTIEDAYRKQLVIANRMCLVEILDTAGQEDYATLRDQWIREAEAFALVYSVDDRHSFERVENFRQAIFNIKQGAPYILVGNKKDKQLKREVSTKEGQNLARRYDCGFLETSAKTAEDADLIFTQLVYVLRQRRSENVGGSGMKESGTKDKNRKCIIM
ncbi:RAS1 protein [Paramarasmius palmivorus]|uniref:RAS1 protein n=1 Tax=Paramarasmius palmivorus TaxID=297713 RepID=A0AAW0CHG3_9AGAR